MGRKEGGAVFGYVLTAAVIWCAVWVSTMGYVARKKVGGTEPPVTVQVAEVLRRDVPVYSEWIGTTDGMVNAVIRAQVQGYLIRQNYHEGDFVRKGQILFEIDPRHIPGRP